MRWVGTVVVMMASSCATTTRFGEGVEVHHVSSPHFEAIGDVPPVRLELEVRRLEQMFDVFTTFFQAQPAEGQKISVVIMREKEPLEFVANASGFVSVFQEAPILVSSVSLADGRSYFVNTHELVRVVASYAIPSPPRWFNEGIAGYFEDASFEKNGAVKMGRWARVPTWVPLDELFTWQDHPASPERISARYASARGFLFFLANRDEARLQRLLAGLRQARPLTELYAELFPPDERAALLERAKAFVEEQKYSAWQTDLLRTAAVEHHPLLRPWEVQLWRSRIFRSLDRTAQMNLALRRAQAEAPTPMPELLAAELLWHDLPAPNGPRSALTHLALADAIDQSFEEQLSAAELAVKGFPSSGFAWYLLARARSKVRDQAGALVAVDRAVALAPYSHNIRMLRVRVLLKLHRCDEARAAFATAIGVLESVEPGRFDGWSRDLEACR